MKLSKETTKDIQAEYDSWKDLLWAGKDKKERQKLGQFATPPQLVFKMLKKFDSLEDKDILDPCLGAGNLIAGAIIAGADPKRCYGVELDPDVLSIAKQRLSKLGVPEANLKLGNALDSDTYEFSDKPVCHDQEAVYIDFSDPTCCIAMSMTFPAKPTAIHQLDISHPSGQDLLKHFIDNAARNGIWVVAHKKTPLTDGIEKTFAMDLKTLAKTVEEQKLNSYDDLLPFAEDTEADEQPHAKKTAPKPKLVAECQDANNIIGRTFEQLLEGNESLSAGKVWRLWAEEAKHAYARYKAWKVGKSRDEAKAANAAYRQWKIDQEAKWCKHFNAQNSNVRKR